MTHTQDDMSTNLVNNRKQAHALATQEDMERAHADASPRITPGVSNDKSGENVYNRDQSIFGVT